MAPWGRKKAKPQHRYAAHQVARPDIAASVAKLQTKMEDWQRRVLTYSRLIPEVMTGYAFVHNTMDLVTMELQRFDRETGDWVTDTDPAMQGVQRKINQGLSIGRAAALMHLVEEAWVLVRRQGAEFAFETLSPTEIKGDGKQVKQRVLDDTGKESWVPVDDGVTVIRIYTPDPEDRFKASGPHEPLLGLLETMALQLLSDQADAVSVLAGNGIFYIPTEILPDEVDSLDASETPGSRRGFEAALEEAMLAPITDRQRGEAVVPITLYGPAEYADSIRHIEVSRKNSQAEAGAAMDRYIQRYARDIDLPQQVILGTGESNHWGDWKVDENTWAYHLRPRGQRIADAIYAGLVKSVVINLGRRPEDYRLVPDPTKAMAKADMSGVAGEAYKAGAITSEAYVEAIGFDASDMRDDAEEALLVLTTPTPGAPSGQTPPDRTATASLNPRIILRQASRAAAAHQRKLEAIALRYIKRAAEDAARDGKILKQHEAARAAELSAGRTAAGIPDLPFDGYVPGHYFKKYADEMAKATNAELSAYLRRISTLTGSDYHLLKAVWGREFEARAAAAAAHADKASEAVTRASFNSGKPVRIGDAPIRTVTSIANGGQNESNGAAGNMSKPTKAGEDPVTKDVLKEAVGAYATIYTWTTGDPERPYEPHQDLEGRTWMSWEEFDSLDVPASDAWLPGTVFFPGDHDGCQCDYEIEFVPAAEASADEEI